MSNTTDINIVKSINMTTKTVSLSSKYYEYNLVVNKIRRNL